MSFRDTVTSFFGRPFRSLDFPSLQLDFYTSLVFVLSAETQEGQLLGFSFLLHKTFINTDSRRISNIDSQELIYFFELVNLESVLVFSLHHVTKGIYPALSYS